MMYASEVQLVYQCLFANKQLPVNESTETKPDSLGLTENML